MEETLFLRTQHLDVNTSPETPSKIASSDIQIDKNIVAKIPPKKPSIFLVLTPFFILTFIFLTFGLAPALLIAALIFEVVNGFHDVSNVVAPLVRSRTLSYRPAVIWSTICTALPLLMIGIASAKIAHTIGGSLFLAGTLTQIVMFSGVTATFSWGLITWRYGLPSSSSHALMGGLAGASMMTAYLKGFSIFEHLITKGWLILIASMILVPIIAGFFAYIITKIVSYLENKTKKTSDADVFLANFQSAQNDNSQRHQIHKKYLSFVKHDLIELFTALKQMKKWPMLLASGMLSFVHSRNDGQKAMPMVAGVIYGDPTRISVLVQLLCYGAITLGTLMGGSLIMKKLNNMGHNHKPSSGVISMGVTSGVVGFATEFGIGVSTTQATASAIMGTSYARKKEIFQIMTAWIITPIASGIIAAIIVLINKI